MAWGIKNITAGLKNATKSPKDIVLNVATLGTYGFVNENKKAVASGAAGAAAAYVTSGGNPLAAVAGGTAGAINAGINKRTIGQSAYQSAAYGAGIGALSNVYTSYVTAKAAAKASADAKILAALNNGNYSGALTAAGPGGQAGVNIGVLGTAKIAATSTWSGVKAATATAAQALGVYGLLGGGGAPSSGPGSPESSVFEGGQDGRDGVILSGYLPGQLPTSEASSPILASVPWPLVLALAPLPIWAGYKLVVYLWRKRRKA